MIHSLLSSSLSLALSITSVGAPIAQDADTETPHNILLIIADDLGTEMLQPYGIGKDIPNTPNLDAMAKQSVLFRNAWSTPLCSPTRACIQTGRLGFRTGMGFTVKDQLIFNGMQASEVILPEMLDAGTGERYSHAFFGKWHLNHQSWVDESGAPKGLDVVREQGYEHFEGTIHNIVTPNSYENWPKVENGVKRRSAVYATTANVDDYLLWRKSAQEPYFAVLAFNAPHSPLHAPPSHLHSTNLSKAGSPDENPRAYYKAMVEALDSEIGRLFENLESERDRTTIIFLGDNGTTAKVIAGDPHKVLDQTHSKGSAYEGGVHVPMYISSPLVAEPGSESRALVHAVDIFATVAELAGVDLMNPQVIPEDRVLDSVSLVPYLLDSEQVSIREINYTEKFFENTPGGAQVDESQNGDLPLCQEVVESSVSPGNPRLSMCGQALVEKSGNRTWLRLEGAPPEGKTFVRLGGFNPKADPKFDDLVLVSTNLMNRLSTRKEKLNLRQPMNTDSDGVLVISDIVFQQNNPTDLYIQVVVQDKYTKKWFASNALKLNQTINVKGVVNRDGYKLMSFVSGGHDELYHLPSDPRERRNLLAAGLKSLSEGEQAAYDSLRAEIARMLATER